MKKTSMFRALAVAFVMLFSYNSWAYDFELDGIYYKIMKTSVSVTYGNSVGNSYSGDVVIPQTVIYNGTEYDVTMIGESAFYSCTDLRTISIPQGIISIGDSAFSWCTSLSNVALPSSLMTIGSYAFSDCTSLFTVTMYDGMVSIGAHAFENDSNLSSMTLPKTITAVGFGAFDGCDNLSPMDIERF